MSKEKFYTTERNVQIVLSLLKANGIKKIIASPGTTNYTLVGSVQNDPYFEVYSSVDERSAAYMACGMVLRVENRLCFLVLEQQHHATIIRV